MTEQPHENEINTNETRYMWIAVAAIVVFLVGGMGINMLIHHDTSADAAQTSDPPR